MSHFLVKSDSIGQVIFTDHIKEIEDMQKYLDGTYWRPDEIKFDKDIEHWRSLSPAMRKVCENAIIEFNVWDNEVSKTYSGGSDEDSSFVSDIKLIQLTGLYTMVAGWEVIHSRSYSKMGTILLGEKRMSEIVLEANRPAYIAKKAAWYKENSKSRYVGEPGTPEHVKDHCRRVLVTCAIEGLFFLPKFASINWIKKKQLLPGFTFANELIARDEGLHARIAGVYARLLGLPVKEKEAKRIFSEAAELECEGVMETHPDGLVGLSKEELCQYVRHSCDFLLTMVYGRPVTVYGVSNPFESMSGIAISRQTNFFEKDVSEYESRTLTTQETLQILNDGDW